MYDKWRPLLGEVGVDPPVVVLPLDVLSLDEPLYPLLDDGGRRLKPANTINITLGFISYQSSRTDNSGYLNNCQCKQMSFYCVTVTTFWKNQGHPGPRNSGLILCHCNGYLYQRK